MYKTVLFVIYIPLDIYFGVDHVVSSLDVKNVIFNLSGFYSNYNGEWWFLFPFILMVLLTPLLHLLRNRCMILLVISIILHSIPSSNSVVGFLFWQTAYVIGFVCGTKQDKLLKFLPQSILGKIAGVIISCFVLEWGMQVFVWEGIIFFVPLFIYVLKEMFNIIPSILRKVMVEFGNKCHIMWLVHSFYCYHFAGDFIYSPRYSILILLNLLLVSYVSAFVISKLENKYLCLFLEGYIRIVLNNKAIR